METSRLQIRRSARPAPNTIDVLNDLFAMHYRSLPVYIREASPWAPDSDAALQRVRTALDNLVAAQQRFANRFAEAILDRNGQVEPSVFPMDFAELNLLSLDFVLKEILRRERQDIGRIQRCVAQLDHDPATLALAEEALGSAHGHLQNLEEALREPKEGGGLRLADTGPTAASAGHH